MSTFIRKNRSVLQPSGFTYIFLLLYIKDVKQHFIGLGIVEIHLRIFLALHHFSCQGAELKLRSAVHKDGRQICYLGRIEGVDGVLRQGVV